MKKYKKEAAVLAQQLTRSFNKNDPVVGAWNDLVDGYIPSMSDSQMLNFK